MVEKMEIIKKSAEQILEEFKVKQAEDFFEYTKKSKSKNSIRAYHFAWSKFSDWCASCGYIVKNPPASSHEFLVGLFIASMAKSRQLKPASLSTYLAGIKHFYAEIGVQVDTRHEEIRKAMSGIRREMGAKQTQKLPLTTDNIKMLVDSIGRIVKPIEARDKALILIGFAGAFRRSELVGIDCEHLEFSPDGVSIFIPSSKTDQEGNGRVVDIPFASDERYCPVRSLRLWMQCCGAASGPVFRGLTKGGKIMPERLCDRSVADMLKRRCRPFGFSNEISGHSLRAGHVTSSIKRGTPETWIMRQTGHTSIATLRKYERLNREFEANSAAAIGL
jgi:integrase